MESYCEETALAPQGGSALDRPHRTWQVKDIERVLLQRFPRADAEEWDRMGLLVGDPEAPVDRIAVALDATVENVLAAKRCCAQVLVTHHPVFLEPPALYGPDAARVGAPGAAVWNAAQAGVALVNVHTALDANQRGNSLLATMLGIEPGRVLFPLSSDSQKGYGRVCRLREADGATVGEIAARCTAVFGAQPRMWGSPERVVSEVAVATGAAGGVLDACVREGVGCLVCGEVKYHAALDALQGGVAVIELGHDVSEIPLAGVLAAVLAEAGFPQERMNMVGVQPHWRLPEAIRL